MWRTLFVLLLLVSGSAMAIEKPSFDIISTIDDVEVRLYHPAILAQTQVSGDFKEVGSDAFQKLGGYIFGKNVADEKIAMTAPVTQTQSPDGSYLVSFFMPSEHSLATLPNPIDAAVTMVEMPETYFAVARYRGGWSQEKYLSQEQRLRAVIATMTGWEIAGEPVWARYDPPIMPSFFRTNEVLIPVRPVLP
tara:strand:- start:2135 stop:2710 length:576 start_codon:yes stop_codon:yes gene_type:complete